MAPRGEGDLGQNAFDIAHHIAVGEADHLEPFAFDDGGAGRIAECGIGMGVAIDFDHERR
jgi:hypothetical protein